MPRQEGFPLAPETVQRDHGQVDRSRRNELRHSFRRFVHAKSYQNHAWREKARQIVYGKPTEIPFLEIIDASDSSGTGTFADMLREFREIGRTRIGHTAHAWRSHVGGRDQMER
jgi:hypothetical protein